MLMPWSRPLRHALRVLVATAVAQFLLWAIALPASADVYSYVQPDGTIAFTNVPTDPRYRKIQTESVTKRLRVPAHALDRAIAQHALLHRLDPALLRAVIKAESNFDPAAVSKAGAVGLMQLMPHTAARLDVRNSYDPEANIAGGARYLRELLDRFRGNLPLALAAYNAGEQLVERYQGLPPIDETRRYVSKVLRFYQGFRSREMPRFHTITPFSAEKRPQPVVFSFAQTPHVK
jgi:soluble lytic murein transglycosylase-like protein